MYEFTPFRRFHQSPEPRRRTTSGHFKGCSAASGIKQLVEHEADAH
ncbi:hypothetical protein [Paenibacillus sp. NRS-1781]